jgi:hypothetical protein
MPNSSATGGYLLPIGTAPADDQELDRIFHDLFVGVTGIDPTLVRPRWAIEPANMPPLGSSWIAQGVTDRRDDAVASQLFDDAIGMTVTRNQELDNLVSFYGVGAAALEALVRDGLSLDQNREAVNALGIALVKVGNPRNASMLINERWAKRIDVMITFRRSIVRDYPILSLTSANVIEHAENITTNINVNL